NFRDLKTTLGLDVLRTHSPALIEREVLVQGIAYNLIRALMLEASRTHSVPLARISFKGAQTALRQWSGLLTAQRQSECDTGDDLKPTSIRGFGDDKQGSVVCRRIQIDREGR